MLALLMKAPASESCAGPADEPAGCPPVGGQQHLILSISIVHIQASQGKLLCFCTCKSIPGVISAGYSQHSSSTQDEVVLLLITNQLGSTELESGACKA